MKIGILTFHRAHNYGAVLQAYSLRNFLLNNITNSSSVEFIDYFPPYLSGLYSLNSFYYLKGNTGFLNKSKRFISDLLTLPMRRRKSRLFDKFISDYLNVDGKSTISSGDQISTDFDLIIFGSDQIWRKNNYSSFSGFDPVFWGVYPVDFKKKASYAASMGVLVSDDGAQEFYRNNLKNFSSVAVRELDLQNLLNQLTDSKIERVLDPVFLLNSNSWRELSSNLEIDQPYLLFYNLLGSKEAHEIAKIIATHYKYKIIEINGNIRPFKSKNRYYQVVGPNDYISLISKAQFVISTSFHGVAFAVIFQKQFYALGMGANSSRVESLLKLLQIEDRLISNRNDINLNELISYQEVDVVREKLRNDSISYLNTISRKS